MSWVAAPCLALRFGIREMQESQSVFSASLERQRFLSSEILSFSVPALQGFPSRAFFLQAAAGVPQGTRLPCFAGTFASWVSLQKRGGCFGKDKPLVRLPEAAASPTSSALGAMGCSVEMQSLSEGSEKPRSCYSLCYSRGERMAALWETEAAAVQQEPVWAPVQSTEPVRSPSCSCTPTSVSLIKIRSLGSPQKEYNMAAGYIIGRSHGFACPQA